MHSVILIWINVQSHFMHTYGVLHVQKKIYMCGLGRGGVMWDTIIDVLELLVKCRNIITFYRTELIRTSFQWHNFILNNKFPETDTFNNQWKSAGTWIKGRVIPRLCTSGAEQQNVCHPSNGCQKKKLEDHEHRLVRSPLFVGFPKAFACVRSLRFCRGDMTTEKVGALQWSQVILQASLASCWGWICGHHHCSLAVLPGKEEPPSGLASSSVVECVLLRK